MSRPKLTPQERALRKAARLLKGTANELKQDYVEDAIYDIKSDRYRPPAYMEAEAVLLSLEKPAVFTYKPCKRCGEMFGTNYRGVGYCSDNCRVKHLQSQTGIVWNPSRATPEERWGGEPPLVIPPSILKLLLPWAEHLVAQATQNQSKMSDELPQQQPQTETEEKPFRFAFDTD